MSEQTIIIKNMISEIQNHKRDKAALLEFYVSKRLNSQVQAYYAQIIDNCSILTHQKNELLVAKRLTK